ncbi:MAG: hypothetical protein CO162_05675 [bacterium (Candidatus Ratteibacteria) CG_4_9_14_3_um_filter_41_21]|uniref:Uncharacterized protein n=4 Tax=Candidatus Ratteibacteria TaxID=2979319 RepID=A0A2M7YF15_9BACT|nr:MAG: hypothetical protein AUJ76_00120 [Candidatus Omnitrophica bacterium CG1_02_41_171]PIV64280.1 MAG: hypothetical protein COS11_03000 [bacterium (Candidatus Ratteibacteria) CG01_land_8_20_14_3_00_40_19]PIW31697.1 MAG: hypothetical protein COW28_06905 [bacterium (Candidatus Ratteibacteria) CG15_BIG_FIL_POST_REV_8_21_14_020_41_12]PIW74153.1 MAG: hypothetical protein CO004_02170 [bacterium (Candidatus Ratteibacteria) CG_4_8_14_3_um_filter_41_36]PJA61556.1 MAG: hypothetical protein CO162_05675
MHLIKNQDIIKKVKASEIVETIIIFLAIFSLWPLILGLPGKIYKFVSCFFLLVLIVILIRKWKRLNKVLRK